jgi:hypothetical protein
MVSSTYVAMTMQERLSASNAMLRGRIQKVVMSRNVVCGIRPVLVSFPFLAMSYHIQTNSQNAPCYYTSSAGTLLLSPQTSSTQPSLNCLSSRFACPFSNSLR